MDQLTALLSQLNAQIAGLMANPSVDQSDLKSLMNEKERIEKEIMELREDYAKGAQDIVDDIKDEMDDVQRAAQDAASKAAA